MGIPIHLTFHIFYMYLIRIFAMEIVDVLKSFQQTTKKKTENYPVIASALAVFQRPATYIKCLNIYIKQ